MGLNKQSGNMYNFVTHTWNAIKGKCSHNCCYCYMKRFKQKPLRLDETEFRTDLGEGNFIFVGSSTDMFARDVPKEWIRRVLEHCRNYKNTYLFQSKNPFKFWDYREIFPNKTLFCITLETNKENHLNYTPTRLSRAVYMNNKWMTRKMVTIEPIMDFDLVPFVDMIKRINPEWVNIGADSNYEKLRDTYGFPEPSKEKVLRLIEELKQFTEVKEKRNLGRLIKTKI